jgi:putative tricarboxylic transport membrane protein
MGAGMLQGLGNINGEIVLYMALGVFVSTVIAILPGIGGVVALALLIPLTYVLDPLAGFAVLIAAVAVTGTGNTITAVLFGMPGTPSGAALLFDGYPMSQKGEGAKAVAAGITASVLGGILGALALAAMIPVARQIVLAISSPEFFMLVILAIVAIAGVKQAHVGKALVAAGLGIAAGFVGLEPNGALRYTFGQLYLWDGIPLVPMLIGMFAVVEMMRLSKSNRAIAKVSTAQAVGGGTIDGIKAAFIHWRTVLQGSAIGVIIGLLPGIGQNAASYIAYGQAARTSKRREFFGTGEVEGVIGPDSATNATDGAQLVPTLAFGIPGGSSMAVVLAGVTILGFQPGPSFIKDNLDIMWMAVYIIVIAGIMGGVFCILLAPVLAKLTFIRSTLLIPAIFGISVVGAYTNRIHIGDIIALVLGSVVGYVFYITGYPRQVFVIALVLGPILEKQFLLSVRLYGQWFFLVRPISAVLTGILALIVVVPLIKWMRRGGSSSRRKDLELVES